MLKRIKLKNSTILLTGVLIICLGIGTGLYEYFEERRNETFSSMNVILFESEQPENIVDTEIIGTEDNEVEDDEIENQDPVDTEEEPNNQSTIVNYTGVLEIPKINLKRGFYNLNSVYNNVDYNITVINGSTFPGEKNNNLILAAHSGDCTVCYFDKLYKLELNDIAYLYYNNRKYTYKIVDIYEVEKDGTVAIYRDYKKSGLTLVTCTRNSNTKQTVYILEETA